MKCTIEGHHYKISEAARTYITETVEKLEKFYDPIIECQVVVHEEKSTFRVDIVTRIQGQTLKASDQDSKLYKAADSAADKMSKQLRKLHDKRRAHRSSDPQLMTSGE